MTPFEQLLLVVVGMGIAPWSLHCTIRAIETHVERRQRLRLGRLVRSERGGLS